MVTAVSELHVPALNVPLAIETCTGAKGAWLVQLAAPAAVIPVAKPPALHCEGVLANVAAVVAAIVPEPVTPRLAPVPTSIAAVVLVPLVKAENAELPPPQPTHPATWIVVAGVVDPK
jgi:hypothetical protein